MTHPFVITWIAFSWIGINAVGLALLAIWGYRYQFSYRGSQPAGEGNAETRELKQVLIESNPKPFGFSGGVSKVYFQSSLLIYTLAGFALVAFFFQFVPPGFTLGEYLRSEAGFFFKVIWVALLLTLHVFHWAAVTKRLRATMKNPWGMVLCAPLLPLYFIQLIALSQGKDGIMMKDLEAQTENKGA